MTVIKPTSLPRQKQIRSSDVYDDGLACGAGLEAVTTLEEDLNAIRSQLARWSGAPGWTSCPADGQTNVELATRTRTLRGFQFMEVSCNPDDVVGNMVAAAGTNRFYTKASPFSREAFPSVAMIVKKPTPTSAVIQFYGLVPDIFTDLVRDARYFLGSDGTIDTKRPVGVKVFSQQVGIAVETDVLLLNPSLNYVVCNNS